MRKLSEYKDEQALDLLADVFEPAVNILTDEDFAKAFDSGRRIDAIKIAIKNHKPEVMTVLAAMEGVPVDEFHCSIFTLPMRLGEVISEIMKNPEVMAFFTQQGKKKSETAFGSATESTEDNER